MAACLLFISCGDLRMAKEKKQKQLKLCDLKVEKFSRIFSENIEKDIDCAYQSLEFYMGLARTERPGELSKSHLTALIKKNFSHAIGKEGSVNIFTMIDFVFDLHYLLFGRDKNFLKPERVKNIYFFTLHMNKIFTKYKLSGHFKNKSMTKKEFEYQHEKVIQAITELKLKFFEYFVEEGKTESTFNLNLFINNNLKFLDKETLRKINLLMFTKKLFLGGERSQLRKKELIKMVSQLPEIVSLLHLTVNFNAIDDDDANSTWKKSGMVIDAINKVENLILPEHSEKTIIATKKEVSEFVEIFFPTYHTFFVYDSFYLKVKEIILGSNNPNLNYVDLRVLFKLMRELFGEVSQYKTAYYKSKSLFMGPRAKLEIEPNNYVTKPQLKINKLEIPIETSQAHRNMLRIMNDYRYFKGSFDFPYFGERKQFNFDAIAEIRFLEFFIKKFFDFYSDTYRGGNGRGVLTQSDLERVVDDMKEYLVNENVVLPGREKNSAETAMLVLSLFQNQSNGDSTIDLAEAVEFGVAILASMDVGEFFLEELKKLCLSDSSCELDQKERVPAKFFRENFNKLFYIKRLGKAKSLHNYFPRLIRYFNSLAYKGKEKEYFDFLKETAAFSRTCTHYSDGTEMPMGENDMLAVFGGMIAVEQTFSRFDRNGNNHLEYKELKLAYKEVYKDAVTALVPEQFKSKSERIFMYLVKHRELPLYKGLFKKIFKAGIPILLNINKPTADRLTIATILKTISEMSPMAKNFPPDCDSYR